jgi:hypothetical protein
VVLDVGAATGIVGDGGDRRGSRPADLTGAAAPRLRELGRGQPAGPHRDGHVLELGASAAPPLLEPVGAAHDGLVGDDHRARVVVGDPFGLRRQSAVGGAEPLEEPLQVAGAGEPLDADPVVPGIGTVEFAHGEADGDARRPDVRRRVRGGGHGLRPGGREGLRRHFFLSRGEA